MLGAPLDPRARRQQLQSVFRQAVVVFGNWKHGNPEPTVTLNGVECTISRICDMLYLSNDLMPIGIATALHMQGIDVTYSNGARMLKEFIVAHKAAPASAGGWTAGS